MVPKSINNQCWKLRTSVFSFRGLLESPKIDFYIIFKPNLAPHKAPKMDPNIDEKSVRKQHGLPEGLPDAPRTLPEGLLDALTTLWTQFWKDFGKFSIFFYKCWNNSGISKSLQKRMQSTA